HDYKIKESYTAAEYRMKTEYWDDQRVQEYLNKPNVSNNITLTKRDSTMVTFLGSVSSEAVDRLRIQVQKRVLVVNLTDELVEKIKTDSRVYSLNRVESSSGNDVFPHDKNWSVDNFGPITIPQAGVSIPLTTDNILLYKRIIEVYEGSELGIENDITLNGNQVLLNGNPVVAYTFLMDYYWMMGDNRQNSADSRSFGFVPFNHVVGKPVFIWMSWDSNAEGIANKIRWERLFTTV